MIKPFMIWRFVTGEIVDAFAGCRPRTIYSDDPVGPRLQTKPPGSLVRKLIHVAQMPLACLTPTVAEALSLELPSSVVQWGRLSRWR